jgi:hypothetical protein
VFRFRRFFLKPGFFTNLIYIYSIKTVQNKRREESEEEEKHEKNKKIKEERIRII